MPRNTAKNTSYYHYKVEKLDDESNIISYKRYLTLDAINEDFPVSRYRIKLTMKNNKPVKGYEKYRFAKDRHPTFTTIPNEACIEILRSQGC